MFIEFSVSNYRSFREKQTFSMCAAPRLQKKDNLIKIKPQGDKIPDLLKAAAIYGPNASGKSNFLKALSVLHQLTNMEPTIALNNPLPASHFRFDKSLENEPSIFEIHFIAKNMRYMFSVGLTQERIHKEELFYYPKGKETVLYKRNYIDGKYKYELGDLEGSDDIHTTWINLTNQKFLFLVQAVSNSSEIFHQLKIPLEWLQSGYMVVDSRFLNKYASASQKLANKRKAYVDDLSKFLQDLDVPVTNIEFERNEINPIAQFGLGLGRNMSSMGDETKEDSKTKLTHKTELGEAIFEFEEESTGTQNLIGFWLPWGLIESYEEDEEIYAKVLFVDELDSSLHPRIVADLIKKHITKNKYTQLIFTTHDTHLMDTKIMRRDQIWIAERNSNGATELRSIFDFSGRESEDIEKRYYEGRYRGLPILRKN